MKNQSNSDVVAALGEAFGFSSYKEALGIMNKTLGSDYVVIGGWAVSHYYRPRATVDMDILVYSSAYDDLLQTFEEAGSVVERCSPDASKVTYKESNLQIMKMTANLEFLMKNKNQSALRGEIIYYPDINDLVAIKISAAMASDRDVVRQKQDEADIAGLVSTGKVDVSVVKISLMKIGASEDTAERLVREFIVS
ncbi:MAG: hypothetical protein AB1546_15615 [bacterium]